MEPCPVEVITENMECTKTRAGLGIEIAEKRCVCVCVPGYQCDWLGV